MILCLGFFLHLPITERATLELEKVSGSRGWLVRQAPESSKKKHIDLIGGFEHELSSIDGQVIRWHIDHLFLPNIGLSKVRMT